MKPQLTKELDPWRSQRAAVNVNSLSEANARGEANAHDEVAYEHFADEVVLPRSKTDSVNWCMNAMLMHAAKLCSGEFAEKAES